MSPPLVYKLYSMEMPHSVSGGYSFYDAHMIFDLQKIPDFEIHDRAVNVAQIVKGYAIGWSSPVISKLQDVEQTPLARVISTIEASWVTSFVLYGIFGAFLAGYGSDNIGRRPCLIIGGILMSLSNGLLTAATNLDMIYAGRFFVGFSVFFSTVTSVIYIGEIASSDIRGIIFTSTGISHALGSLIAYCVGPFLSYAGVGYVAIGISAIYTVTSFYLPESPVYYVLKDNAQAARASLEFLGRSKDINNELKTMIENAKENKNNKHVWRELFTVKSNRRCFYVTVPLSFFQQFSGIICVVLYSTTIFKVAGSSIHPDIATIVVGAALFFGTVLSPFAVERYGRRVLLIVSASGFGVTMAILGVYFHLEKTSHELIESLRWLPLACLVVALLSFGFGLSMIPNTLAGELFRPNVRGLGSAISLSIGWMAGLISATVFGYMVVALGNDVTFWIYAAINAVTLIFVITIVPETKGKSLTEIDAMMAG